MLNSFLTFLSRRLVKGVVYAHCDIPCGIYDPHQMQVAAHTVLRMTQLIEELEPPKFPLPDVAEAKKKLNSLARYVAVKEEHAELCKREVRILWGDYFKAEHLEQYPELHDTVWKVLKVASTARQEVSLEAAAELLSLTQLIAEVFWKTKGVETVRGKSFYPTEGEMVYPKV